MGATDMEKPMQEEWVNIKDAIERLGRGWSRNSIKRRIEQGQLKEGIHYRDDRLPQSIYSTYKLNITAIVRDFSVPILQRCS
jgi:hypothetical protein